uniref:Uncharacterized protein n=1 Tax=viral metagenome TaxID=1070528 RepID=A0A6C0K2A1_9ZZZZ
MNTREGPCPPVHRGQWRYRLLVIRQTFFFFLSKKRTTCKQNMDSDSLKEEIYDHIQTDRRVDFERFLQEKHFNKELVRCLLDIRSRFHDISFPGFYSHMAPFLSDRDLIRLRNSGNKTVKKQTQKQVMRRRYTPLKDRLDVKSLTALINLLPSLDASILQEVGYPNLRNLCWMREKPGKKWTMESLVLRRQIIRLLLNKGLDLKKEDKGEFFLLWLIIEVFNTDFYIYLDTIQGEKVDMTFFRLNWIKELIEEGAPVTGYPKNLSNCIIGSIADNYSESEAYQIFIPDFIEIIKMLIKRGDDISEINIAILMTNPLFRKYRDEILALLQE